MKIFDQFRQASKRKRQNILTGWGIGIGIFIIILVVMALIPVVPYEVYRDERRGVQMKYPAFWQVVDKPEGGAIVAFIAPKRTEMDVFNANANLTLAGLPPRISMRDQLNNTIIEQITGTFGENIKILSSEKAEVAGQTGYKLVYVGQAQGLENPLKYLHYWVVVEGRGVYIFTYAARENDFDYYLGMVNTMVKSWTIF